MYNIFYIYTYKYIKPSNTLTLSRTQRARKPTSYKQPNKLYSLTSAERKLFIYGQKCTNRIMHQAIQLATCTYAAILKNCIMRSVFQFCLCFVTTLKIFCNFFVICRAKWVYTYVGKLKIDIIRTYIRPKALAL